MPYRNSRTRCRGDHFSKTIITSRHSLLQNDQGHGDDGGGHAGGFERGEAFFQDQACQDHGDDRVKRGEHDRDIQSSGLTGAHEAVGAGDVEQSRDDSDPGQSVLQALSEIFGQRDRPNDDHGRHTGESGNPNGRTVARLLKEEKETGETEPGDDGET